MRHQPPLAPSPDHDGARRFSAPDLPEWFQQLAELARAAASAALCTLAWKSYSSGGNASAPAASGKSQDLACAALELLGTGNAAAQTRPARREHFLSRPELARVGEQMGVRAELVWACDFVRDDAELKVVLVADRERASSEIKAILSMTGQAGLAALTAFELNQSRSFWRDRASEVSSDLARTKATREAADQRQSELESAFATLERATGRDREPTIDRVLVRLGMRRDFDGSEGPLAHEFATRLGTLRRAWTAEDELARYRTLAQQMALRMFAAVDQERARIARDLHDDHAQLLAAATLAIDAEPESGRDVFRKLTDQLRRRTRELRPAALDHHGLSEAIKTECGLLREAGLAVKLLCRGRLDLVARPIQTLCYQVLREAISNVVRHARARRVEIKVERTGTSVRIAVSDDGAGVTSRTAESMGLKSLGERLELMGGLLSFESKAGQTILRAEIPEPA